VRKRLLGSWTRNRSHWLAGGGQWPLVSPLGRPTQSDARLQLDAVKNWVRAWQAHAGAGQVEWEERAWPELGCQRLPCRLLLQSPDEVAVWAGEERRWCLARTRYQRVIERWPPLAENLPKHFDVLADYSEPDFERLLGLVSWLLEHPRSNLYPRQLPVVGLDSKWLETRRALIADLVGALRQIDLPSREFYTACGLRPLPSFVRLKVLDDRLRARIGGLRDLAVPVDDLSHLDLPAKCLFVVENLQTGLAFDDLDDALVVMGLGYGVDALHKLRGVQQAAVFYWGDIDTHGFAILNRARGHVPRLKSLLMDEETLRRHKDLCAEEPSQHGAESLPNLTAEELALYRELKVQKWGRCLRLEQERIPWPEAWQKIRESRDFAVAHPMAVSTENSSTLFHH
jgi:hypothetical protein